MDAADSKRGEFMSVRPSINERVRVQGCTTQDRDVKNRCIKFVWEWEEEAIPGMILNSFLLQVDIPHKLEVHKFTAEEAVPGPANKEEQLEVGWRLPDSLID